MSKLKVILCASLVVFVSTFAFSQPANNDCAAAIPIMNGLTPFATLGATTDGSGCSANQDIWFLHTATNSGDLMIDLCGSTYDTYLAVYDYTGSCPPGAELACNDDACGVQSMATVTVQAGLQYLIRIGGFDTDSGSGQVSLAYDSPPVTGLSCTPGASDAIVATWTNPVPYQDIEIYLDGTLTATLAGTETMFSANMISPGTHTLCVAGVVATSGPAPQQCCTIDVAGSCDATDVILALEGFALIDSATALSTALTNQGYLTAVYGAPPITSIPCLDTAERIWVITGSYPNDYRITAAEGDYLAGLAAQGASIYFEGGDHWGFQPVFSQLDERDGIDSGIDGDDSFTAMNGQLAPVAGVDFSIFTNVTYNQDQAGNDYTDQLTVTTPGAQGPLTSAESLWEIASGAYVTAVIAIHSDGGRMISSSFEFGGYGGNQDELAGLYATALGGVAGPEFQRGDANDDGSVSLPDAVFLLGFLFPGGGTPNVIVCDDAADANDDGAINLPDAIALLNALFGIPPISLPGPAMCDTDPTDTDTLDCAAFTSCP